MKDSPDNNKKSMQLFFLSCFFKSKIEKKTKQKNKQTKKQITKKLVERYGISVSQISTDMFHLS